MLIKRTQFFLGFTLSPRTHQFHNNFSLGHQLVHQTYIIYSYNCKDRINICRNTPKTHSNWYSKDPYTCSHYSPIVNNLSLTSKRAHVCILTAIATSLIVSWDSSSFPSDCSGRVFKRQREKKGLKPPFHCLRAMSISPFPQTLFCISQRWRCAQMNHESHIKISRQFNC